MCTDDDDGDDAYTELYATVAEQMDADVLGSNDPELCKIVHPDDPSIDLFGKLPYLTSNPPSVSDLITIFEGDTKTTLIATAQSVAAS